MGRGIPPPLPFDVLRLVFDDVSSGRDLAAAALVCRDWTEPAQVTLYQRRLHLVLGEPLINRSRTSLFARTMETCPHLRPLVHDISMVLWRPCTKELTRWLQLIPENVVRKFKYMVSESDIPLLYDLAILDTPCVRTVTDFRAGQLYSMDEISVILSLPCLTHLTIEYTASFGGDVDPALARASPIKHLKLLSLITGWCPGVFSVFVALAPRLESFTTDGRFPDQRYAPWRDEMEAEIVRHGRTLRTLIIDARRMETPPSTPFLDALVEDNASLVHLRIFPGAYTELLFTHLPDTLEVLEIDLGFHGVGAVQPGSSTYEALLECICRARGPWTRAALREVVYRRPPGGFLRYVEIARACALNGIKFRCALPGSLTRCRN